MEIKYYKNGKTTIARGFKNTYGPEGVCDNTFFSALASNKLTAKDRSILMSSADFTSTATPCGDDTYDDQVGLGVARDKTIIKNCKREYKQLMILSEYLKSELANVEKRICDTQKKQERAEKRLSSY